jgi:peptidoglycan L-alanyl-D-glutamate endopeptidase CwlK
MGKYKFSQKSLQKLEGVHDDLRRLMMASIVGSPIDFGITCGLRTVTEQQRLVKEGKSRTMNSRHLTGHAVDVVCYNEGKATWEEKYYTLLAGHILGVAAKLNIPLVWGGSFKGFFDGPHFELNRQFYKNVDTIA